MVGELWVVKDKIGRIFGPLSTEKIVELIDKTVFVGDESIAPYPDGDWIELSQYPQFYDRLLDVLSGAVTPLSEREREAEFTKAIEETQATSILDSQTEVIETDPKTEAPKTTTRTKRGLVHREKDVGFPTTQSLTIEREKERERKKEEESKDLPADISNEVIDLSSEKSIKEKEKKKSSGFSIIFILVIALGAYLLLQKKPEKKIEHKAVRLIGILKPGKMKESDLVLEDRFKKGVEHFLNHTFFGYYKAQIEFAKILQSNPVHQKALGMLCLTHRELWPYAHQDSKDLAVISQVTQVASKADPMGMMGSTCRTVQLLIDGRYQLAQTSIKTVLTQNTDAGFFYEMKGQLITDSGELSTAMAYIKKAQQILPEWAKPYLTEARIYMRLGQYNKARAPLERVLKAIPKHPIASAEYGVLLHTQFRKTQEAHDFILIALKNGRLPKALAAKANKVLAMIYYQIPNNKLALKHAKEAFVLSPSDLELRKLITKLGGKVEAGEKLDEQGLVALGNRYMKGKNYFAAQAEFKAAFEINPRNGVAALRAGQCLWSLNQSLEAIDWVKKAIRADSKLIDAYVTLADYYSAQFDFRSASGILMQAQRRAKGRFEIFRAYALVELRKKSMESAIGYGKRALKTYDNDVETHLIIAKAHLGMGDFQKAYEYVARAIEIDANDVNAQALYAVVLGSFQGLDESIKYVDNLINTYPNQVRYYIALGQIYERDEKYDKAAEAFKTATEIDERSKEALLSLARVYKAGKKEQYALQTYLAAAALDPSDAYPTFLVGKLFYEQKKYDSAMRQFQRAQQTNAKYPLIHYWIGKTAFAQNNLRMALEWATKEQQLNPRLADPYLLAGEVLLRKGHPGKAAQEFQKAVQLRPQGADVYIMLARAYRQSSSFQVAEKMLSIAAKLEDGNPEIYKEHGFLYQAMGENEKAASAYELYLSLAPNAPDALIIRNRINSLGGGI
jgi:tetratricopeptide (TPR) repeat protein